jgi:hypothetical protein
MGNLICSRKKHKYNDNYKTKKALTQEDLSILIQQHVKKEMILSVRRHDKKNIGRKKTSSSKHNKNIDILLLANEKMINENLELQTEINHLKRNGQVLSFLQQFNNLSESLQITYLGKAISLSMENSGDDKDDKEDKE